MADLQFAGDYELEGIFAHAASTPVGGLDIKPLLLELNIYESIFSPSITGSITIADSQNHLQNVPFKGQEELEFKLGISLDKIGRANEQIDFSKHRMRVTKVSNVNRVEERQQVYTLNFTSRETLTNLRTSLNQIYKGTADQIIQNVLQNNLKIQKRFRLEETVDSLTLLGNRMKPFSFCTMVANKGSSKKYNDDQLYFFENHRGYVLASISGLADTEPQVKYYSAEGRAEDRNYAQDMERILSYRVSKNQDLIAHITTGLINSTQYTYDINTKSYNKTEHSYFNEFNNTPHTSDKPFPIYTTQPESADGKILDSFTSSVTKVSTTNSFLHTIDADDTIDYSNTTSKDQTRLFSRLNHDALTVSVTVPGNSVLAAGDVVELSLPSLEPISKAYDRTYDAYMSGKYIITNIVHTVSPTNYTTTFDCAKDSVDVPYVTSIEPVDPEIA